MDRDTFNFYVMLAYFMLKNFCQEYGERLADVWIHFYVIECDKKRREELLEELIECSDQVQEAWDALILILQYHYIQGILPLPKSLVVLGPSPVQPDPARRLPIPPAHAHNMHKNH